ncbi:MAG: histidinol-phosphatase [Cyclobacteriaceae bacterium]|nr:MAG: histidinol-phosphatase [Cyclobacteriaceae bacterium]
MRLLFTIIFCIFQGFAFAQDLKWFKGNTHTHSYWSDGDDFPEMIMDWYKSRGYNFVCLSDHNVLAQGEKWKRLPSMPSHQRRFEEYLEKFGKDWVEYRTDTAGRTEVKLKTLEAYRPLYEEPGQFLIIPAEEITDQFEKKPIHINVINVQELIVPQGGTSVVDVMQNNLNQVYEQRERTGQPMFPHINHPNFGWAITVEDMKQINGERFFEVYNGHPLVHNYGDSLRMGTEQMWDELLIDYLKHGKALIYGLATDDAHHYLNFNTKQSNPGRGFIMVRAKALTPKALIDAMERGEFYSSTGVLLNDVSFKKNRLRIEIKTEQTIQYTIQFFGAQKDEGAAHLIKEVKKSRASFKVSQDMLYVRARIVSSKPKENPYQEGDFETAWVQPVVPQL